MVQDGSIENFSIDCRDCLRFCNRICVPNIVELKELILHEAHDNPFALHPNGTKMYRDLRELYRWLEMKREMVEFVAKCLLC